MTRMGSTFAARLRGTATHKQKHNENICLTGLIFYLRCKKEKINLTGINTRRIAGRWRPVRVAVPPSKLQRPNKMVSLRGYVELLCLATSG